MGANQYTGPACGAKKCLIAAAAAGDITISVNKGRRAGPMSSLLLLDVYGLFPKFCKSYSSELLIFKNFCLFPIIILSFILLIVGDLIVHLYGCI